MRFNSGYLKLKDRKASNKNILVLIILVFSSIISVYLLFHQNNIMELIRPSLPEHIILHPTYTTTKGELCAGTAFIFKPDDTTNQFIVTALHIFGPAGGLDKQIESTELPGFIKNISFQDVYDDSLVSISATPLKLPGAKVDGININTDMAALKVSSKAGRYYLKPSNNKPRVGEHVWLAASVIEGAPKQQKLHEAVVTVSNDKIIEFKYKNPKIKFTATSGAPVLNKRKEVVGINVGGYRKDNELIGAANPIINLRNALMKLMKN